MSALRATDPPHALRALYLLGTAAGAAALLLGATHPDSRHARTDPGSTSHPPGPATAVAPAPTPGAPAPPAGEPTPERGAAPPTARTPQDLAAALRAAVPTDATDARISGAYGSGHHGTWRFTVFVTWRTSTGGVQGGRVDLPDATGGTPQPVDLGYPDDRLHREHEIGWTLQQLDTALQPLPAAAGVAMLELQIPASGTPTFTSCTAPSTSRPARCTEAVGQKAPRSLPATLTDQPDDGALAVQRRAAPRD